MAAAGALGPAPDMMPHDTAPGAAKQQEQQEQHNPQHDDSQPGSNAVGIPVAAAAGVTVGDEQGVQQATKLAVPDSSSADSTSTSTSSANVPKPMDMERTTTGQDALQDAPYLPQDEDQHQPNACHRCWDSVEPWVLAPQRRNQWIAFAAFWAAVVGLAVFFLVWAFPRIVDAAFDPALAKIDASLTRVQIGVLVATCCMVLPWTIVLPPDPAIWVAAALFSFGEAFAMVMVGSTLSMAPPFLLVRLKVGGPLLRFLQRYKRTNAILLSVRKAGPFMTVLIIRLGPVPNSLANYLLGLPKSLDFLRYMGASTLGIIPGVVVAVIFGRNIKGLADMLRGESVPAAQIAVNLVSLFAGIALLIGGYIYAKRVMDEMEKEAAEEERLRIAGLLPQGSIPPPPPGPGGDDGSHPAPVVVHAIPLPLPYPPPSAAAAALSGAHLGALPPLPHTLSIQGQPQPQPAAPQVEDRVAAPVNDLSQQQNLYARAASPRRGKALPPMDPSPRVRSQPVMESLGAWEESLPEEGGFVVDVDHLVLRAGSSLVPRQGLCEGRGMVQEVEPPIVRHASVPSWLFRPGRRSGQVSPEGAAAGGVL